MSSEGLVGKIIAGAAAGGGAVVLSASTVAGDPAGLPAADIPTVLNLLLLSAVAYIWTQIRSSRNQPETEKVTNTVRDEWRDVILKKLEDMAFGVRKTSDGLIDHRQEFAEFRGETRATLESFSGRLDKLEYHVTGETRRG